MLLLTLLVSWDLTVFVLDGTICSFITHTRSKDLVQVRPPPVPCPPPNRGTNAAGRMWCITTGPVCWRWQETLQLLCSSVLGSRLQQTSWMDRRQDSCWDSWSSQYLLHRAPSFYCLLPSPSVSLRSGLSPLPPAWWTTALGVGERKHREVQDLSLSAI